MICTEDAVRMNDSMANTVNRVIEDKIKTWLRQARDRDGGRKRRFLAAAAASSGQATTKRQHLFEELQTDRDSSTESD